MMIVSVHVDFEYLVESEDGRPPILYTLRASYTPAQNAYRSGRTPCSWEAPDGSQIEDLEVYWPGGVVRVPEAEWRARGIDRDHAETLIEEMMR
jgi:hypothetical protein